MKLKTATITQKVIIPASPEEVYDTFIDPKKHTAFTGAEAICDPRIGGEFTAWDGYITGKNLELLPDKKIVQSWRYSDWPEGHYSKATFSFKAVAGETRLTFTQTGVPEELRDDIAQGWRDYYWAPMKQALEPR